MEIDTTREVSPEFPFYYTWYEDGMVKGCVHDAEYGCKECVCKLFCLCRGDK